MSECTGLVPGETSTLALVVDLDEGWHVYWPGQNDTGLAVEFDLSVPAGYEAEKALWPAPHRHVSPGGILDHVYEKDQATILIPVRVPADATPGGEVDFSINADWQVCSDRCLLGDGTADLTLPVLVPGEPPAPGVEAERIAAARRRLPVPLPKSATDLSVRWADGVLDLRALRPVKEITFSPDGESRTIDDLLDSGAGEGGVLRLRPAPGNNPVSGVVELVLDAGARPRMYRIETMPPGE
ncbi:MAG: protein-disulfide reductase DsbD N-terminal domain-containing protein [Phycisphaeraceae bacterium]|nr:MAG: protein-disulfide reductase DsbD N-terminal domain-containing protein [Phycisphaeraceae bacterium]